jgi:hypothetical protein
MPGPAEFAGIEFRVLRVADVIWYFAKIKMLFNPRVEERVSGNSRFVSSSQVLVTSQGSCPPRGTDQ